MKGNKIVFYATMNTISKTKNKFAVGCDTFANLEFLNGVYFSGCMADWRSLSNVVNGSYSSIKCCEIAIFDGLKYTWVELYSFKNRTDV